MRFLFLTLIAILATGSALAEQLPLKPITAPVEKKCGALFGSNTYGANAVVVFAYMTPEGVQKGTAVLKMRAHTHIVESVGDKPTFEAIRESGGDGARFRMSQAEYDKAKAGGNCIPSPEPDPATTK